MVGAWFPNPTVWETQSLSPNAARCGLTNPQHFGAISCFLKQVLNGCGPPTAEIMNSWKGNHISDVIRSWGPPQQVTTDGAGGRIYVWSKNVNIPLTKAKSKTKRTVTYSPYLDQYTIKSKTTYTEPVVIEGQKVRMFWANKNGIVYHWRAKGFIVEEGDTEAVIVIAGIVLVVLIIAEQQRRARYAQIAKLLDY